MIIITPSYQYMTLYKAHKPIYLNQMYAWKYGINNTTLSNSYIALFLQHINRAIIFQ